MISFSGFPAGGDHRRQILLRAGPGRSSWESRPKRPDRAPSCRGSAEWYGNSLLHRSVSARATIAIASSSGETSSSGSARIVSAAPCQAGRSGPNPILRPSFIQREPRTSVSCRPSSAASFSSRSAQAVRSSNSFSVLCRPPPPWPARPFDIWTAASRSLGPRRLGAHVALETGDPGARALSCVSASSPCNSSTRARRPCDRQVQLVRPAVALLQRRLELRELPHQGLVLRQRLLEPCVLSGQLLLEQRDVPLPLAQHVGRPRNIYERGIPQLRPVRAHGHEEMRLVRRGLTRIHPHLHHVPAVVRLERHSLHVIFEEHRNVREDLVQCVAELLEIEFVNVKRVRPAAPRDSV